MIINRIHETQNLLSLLLLSILVGLRTYQHPCSTVSVPALSHGPTFAYRIIFDAKCINVVMIDANPNFRSNHLLRCQSTDIKCDRVVIVIEL